MVLNRIAKGDYGYLEKQTQRELIKTLIFFMSSFGVLLIGIILTGTKNNLLTIVAVLGFLPAAKELITCIMFTKAKKFRCPQAFYDEVQNAIIRSGDGTKADDTDKDDTDGAGTDEADVPLVVYDLYMTSQEKNYPILSMCCRNKTLIGIADWQKFDYPKAEEHIRIMLKQNGHKNVAVKIFPEREKYISRIKELQEQKAEHVEEDQAILRLMLNLSL